MSSFFSRKISEIAKFYMTLAKRWGFTDRKRKSRCYTHREGLRKYFQRSLLKDRLYEALKRGLARWQNASLQTSGVGRKKNWG
jgi:hypothetical protein